MSRVSARGLSPPFQRLLFACLGTQDKQVKDFIGLSDPGAATTALLLQGSPSWAWSVEPASPQDTTHVRIRRSFKYIGCNNTDPSGGLAKAEAAANILALGGMKLSW